MSFYETSRRDDLHSLVYLLTYLLNKGIPKGLHDIPDLFKINSFTKILDVKVSQTLDDLTSGSSAPFEDFILKIFRLDFNEQPNYSDLKASLTSISKKWTIH